MNKEIDFQIDFILQDIIEFHRELAADGEIIMSDGIVWYCGMGFKRR